jgi:predicted alpha/beta-hydrolase family hydrolase
MTVPGVPATHFEPEGDRVGTAILVPGRGYPPVAPLLWFAQQSLLGHGWAVRHLWWDPPAYADDEQTGAWVRAQVETVLPDSGPVMVVAKSLGTYAAPLVAERGFSAIWFTPLLQVPVLVEALAAATRPRLLVGGTADEIAWRADVAGDLAARGCDVLEVAGADHGMGVGGDAVRAAEVQLEVTRGVESWLGDVSDGSLD